MITVIANLKGGSGKSTIAFNLAVWLEKNGREVVGYDLDPQCTFSDLAMLRKETGTTPDLTIHSANEQQIQPAGDRKGRALPGSPAGLRLDKNHIDGKGFCGAHDAAYHLLHAHKPDTETHREFEHDPFVVSNSAHIDWDHCSIAHFGVEDRLSLD